MNSNSFSLLDQDLQNIFQQKWNYENVKNIEIAKNRRINFIRLRANSSNSNLYLEEVLQGKKIVIYYDDIGNNLIIATDDWTALIDMSTPLTPNMRDTLKSITKYKIIIYDASGKTQEILSEQSININATIIEKDSFYHNEFKEQLKQKFTGDIYDYFEDYMEFLEDNCARGNPIPSKVIAYLTVAFYPSMFVYLMSPSIIPTQVAAHGPAPAPANHLIQGPPPGMMLNPQRMSPGQFAPQFQPQMGFNPQYAQSQLQQFNPMPFFNPMPAPTNQFVQSTPMGPLNPARFAPINPANFAPAPANNMVQNSRPAFVIDPSKLMVAQPPAQQAPKPQAPPQMAPPKPAKSAPMASIQNFTLQVIQPSEMAKPENKTPPPAAPSIDTSKIAVKKEATGGVTNEFWSRLEKMELSLKARGELELDGLKFKCSICKQKFTSPVYLLQHTWEEHKDY